MALKGMYNQRWFVLVPRGSRSGFGGFMLVPRDSAIRMRDTNIIVGRDGHAIFLRGG